MPVPWVPIAMTVGSMAAEYIRNKMGHKAKAVKTPTVTPEGSRAMNWAMQRGQQQYSNPYEGFEPIRQNAMSAFQESTLPQVQANWQGQGSSDALSSGTFGTQLGAAYRGLGNDLAAMQSQYGLNNQRNAMSLMDMGMKPQFENILYPSGDTAGSAAVGNLGRSMGAMGASGMAHWMDDYMNQPAAAKKEETAATRGTPVSAAATEQQLREVPLRQQATNQFAQSAGSPFNQWQAPQDLPSSLGQMRADQFVQSAGNPMANWNPSMPVGGGAQYMQGASLQGRLSANPPGQWLSNIPMPWQDYQRNPYTQMRGAPGIKPGGMFWLSQPGVRQ